MSRSVLIVEDERVLRESLVGLMQQEGFEVLEAENGRRACEIALDRPIDLVLSDVRMPEMDGPTLLGRLKQIAPETPVIMLTAYGTVESAVAAMRNGAWDYLLKPVQFEDLLLKVQRALEFRDLRREHHVITEQLAAGWGDAAGDASGPPGEAGRVGGLQNIVSQSPNMLRLFEQVRKLSDVKSSVLVMGDSGTGKELFARAIHYNGVTRTKPFVAVNCGAIPESLIESELFGHRKGAFTGAVRDRVGYFEAANGGTIFLDEISTLPRAVQSSMLRVLEERVVVPVGDTRPRPIDVRVIAASNQDLTQMASRGEFREDLLFRLNVVSLTLPPLRQRRSDIPLLVEHFLAKYSREMNRHITHVSNAAMRALITHEWRGNVRELENVIERAVIFADGREIRLDDLPFGTHENAEAAGEDLRDAVREFERQHIIGCLRRHAWDKTEVAKCLGIGISSLYRKLEELDIPKANGQDTAITPENVSS